MRSIITTYQEIQIVSWDFGRMFKKMYRGANIRDVQERANLKNNGNQLPLPNAFPYFPSLFSSW